MAATNGTNELWLIPPQGELQKLDSDLNDASGIEISPDGF
jgi:hypothetical protein